MRSSTTSPTLLSRVRNPADRVAWREFDERYGEMIVRYGRRCGLQHADAEDIRQIVMVRLSKALLGFNYSPLIGKFRSFVGRIVRNEVIRLISRPKIASRRVDSDGGELREPINEEKLDRQWEREWADHHLRRAVTLLRRTHEPRSIDVFEQLLAGQTVECVAADFSMTTQAVHKVKQRIRNRLKEIIAGQIREEDQPNG